jgi:hypothetical protein
MTSGNLDLFKMALGLEDPWKVTRTDFNPEGGRLDVQSLGARLDFGQVAGDLAVSAAPADGDLMATSASCDQRCAA